VSGGFKAGNKDPYRKEELFKYAVWIQLICVAGLKVEYVR
jgi:hypothetical protein